MDEKICLDTDVCIEIINGNKNFLGLLNQNKDVYITSITAFELLLRKTNIETVESFLYDINILDFDMICAKIASNVQKDLDKAGMNIEFRDIFIASISIINNCTLATLNKKHFSRIKNLKLLEV